MEILQVNAQDSAGGAERIVLTLDESLRSRGIGAQLLVGKKCCPESASKELPNHSHAKRWSSFWSRVHHGALRRKWIGIPQVASLLKDLAYPGMLLGRENFHFPDSYRLLSYCKPAPDLVHFHNLHQDFFDLRYLSQLSHEIPVVITLHDSWLLSGHCAHGIECDRWKTGCGRCPDLAIYPSVRRDATSFNWRRKADIFAASRLHIVTPSRWLMDRVKQSMLWPGVVSARTIHNGVDLDTFRPFSKSECRKALGISDDTRVILFAANGIRANPFKDFATLRSALLKLGQQALFPILALAVGDTAESETMGSVELRFVEFQKDPTTMAKFYNACDVYVHAARVDTFPNSILEAMACGVPVIASAVGGIPEQVVTLHELGKPKCGGVDNPTGFLVPVGDADQLCRSVLQMLQDDSLRTALGSNARDVAVEKFGLEKQTDNYIELYQSVLGRKVPQMASGVRA